MTLDKNLLYGLTLIAFSCTGQAENISFYKGDINYWAEEKIPPSTAPSPSQKSEEQKTKTRFDWNKVMDPKNDEFFKEGDYTPPAPFMEVARNPSDENIRMWHAYIEKKNLLAQRLQMRLQEFSGRGQASPVILRESVPSSNSYSKFEPSRYQFRMYFDSECPHCQRMMGTMKELSLKGAAVEAKQVDDGPFNASVLPFVVSKATKEEVKRHGISSVPFLLVGDLKKKVVYKLNGYKTVSSIFEEINANKKD